MLQFLMHVTALRYQRKLTLEGGPNRLELGPIWKVICGHSMVENFGFIHLPFFIYLSSIFLSYGEDIYL